MPEDFQNRTVRENCPNTEFFLVHIFRIHNEYEPEKTTNLDTFHAVETWMHLIR